MEKILNSEARKALFETMKENGFTQRESTEIIGKKFMTELEKLLKEAVSTLDKGMSEENYELMDLTVSNTNEWNISNLIKELMNVRKQLGINTQKTKVTVAAKDVRKEVESTEPVGDPSVDSDPAQPNA